MPDPALFSLAQQFKQALADHETVTMRRVVDAYQGIARRLDAEVNALLFEVSQRPGGIPSRSQIMRMKRYQQLMEDVQAELEKYQAFLSVEIETSARAAADLAVAHSQALMNASMLAHGVEAAFRTLPPESVIQMLGFLDPKGPLYQRIQELAPATADLIARALLDGIALGRNPRVIAREIVQRKLGMALTDAMRMTRTANLYTYREAARANYLANNDVVTGWQWMATLGDSRTCMACVAMHGTVHTLDERLNDHHCGRCSAVPISILDAENPITEKGEEYFNKLPVAAQKARMGKSRWQAWQDGQFTFQQLVREHEDDVYGWMRSEASLKDLIGSSKPSPTQPEPSSPA